MTPLRHAFLTATLTLLAAVPAAARQTPPLVSDLLRDVAEVQEKMVGLAEAMPAGSYDWRPSEGVRSVGEVFKHLASDNWLLPAAMGHPAPEATGIKGDDYRTAVAYERRAMDKAEIVRAVSESFAHIQSALTATSAARLDERVDVFGGEMTVRALLLLTVTHLHEHLGQSIAYARSNGVTPPWSR
jgi:uncharacterized damage-inducible protein DinB